MTDDKRELDDLPELPELAELQELPELPEIEDLPELPDEAVSAAEPELFDHLDPLDRKVDVLDELPELPDEVEEELEPLDDLEPIPVAEEPLEDWAPVDPEPKPAPVQKKPAAAPAPKAPVKKTPVVKAPAPAPKPAPAAKPAAAAKPVLAPAPAPAKPASVEPEPVAAAAETPLAAPAAAALAPGEKPPLRVLDKALVHLALAAKIVVLGALVPFMVPTNEMTLADGLGITLGSKVLVILAAWLWMQQVQQNWEPTLKGGLKGLAGFHLKLGGKKEEDEKKKSGRRVQKQAPTTLEHPFPTGLHLLAIVLIIAAIGVAVQDPRQGVAGPLALAEMGMCGWAAFTFVHVANYERWGSFNPLFPLMFLGMLFSGLASIAAGIGAEGAQKIASLVGGLGVGAGGGLAAYTIVESMMHAKKAGDLKKAEALEARKAARKSRKS